jgi:hypothetical protein
MAVDLGDLVESLQREVNPPGQNLYPDATENEWIGHLADAFWEARLHGMLQGYIVDPAFTIVPLDTSAPDMGRDWQQLIVLYAGFRITLTEFKNTQSSFHAVAGPVEIEVQKASNVLKGVLDAIKSRIDIVLRRLSDVGATSVAVFDAVIEQTYDIATREQWFVR